VAIVALVSARRGFGVSPLELWALVDSSTPTMNRVLGGAVDVYLGEEEARKALAGVVRDEPSWMEILTVERIATVDLSAN
jgi:hypothetical protein